jgi:predicted DNA-binding transcriptional regulator AlpA
MMKKRSKEEFVLQKNWKSRKEELKLPKNYKSSFVMTKMKKACHYKYSNKLSIPSKISLKKLVKWMTMSFKKWSFINSKT